MLISHKHKFIFIKTKKTASTSTEDFFSRYCVPWDYESSHTHDEYQGETGIVGARVGGKRYKDTKYNFNVNSGIKQVKSYLSEDAFNSYFKFTTIRNPYDRMVSLFYFIRKEKNRQLVNDGRWHGHAVNNFNDEIKSFRAWIQSYNSQPPNYISDYGIFSLNGAPIMDFYIRFENLKEDIESVCSMLNLEYDLSNLKKYKSEYRDDKSYQRFYTTEEVDIVTKLHKWEIDNFKYSF